MPLHLGFSFCRLVFFFSTISELSTLHFQSDFEGNLLEGDQEET